MTDAPQENVCIPNSFQTPNIIVDRLMELVDGDEYKVVSFANRHILGWRGSIASRRACISYNMFLHGFEANGKKYAGTGLSRSKLNTVLKNMVAYGVMRKIGNATNDGQEWQLPFDEPGAINWEGLQARKAKADEKAKKRTRAAAATLAAKRQQNNGSGPLYGPLLENGEWSVGRTTGSLSNRQNQTHRNTHSNPTRIT